jgi:DNA-binding transcriptional regulator YiaG
MTTKKNTEAQSAAFEPLVDQSSVLRSIEYFARRMQTFQGKADDARSSLRDLVVRAVQLGLSESEAARLAGVTRMTVRSWCGK